jgi:hypothetical protein
MSAKMLRDKRILWGSIFIICITLSLLIAQPASVMLAESSRPAIRTSVPSSISLKRLQSSSTQMAEGVAEVPSPQYGNDTLNPSLAPTPEPTAVSRPIYVTPSPAQVILTPTPSPTPIVDASPTPLPASPTVSSKSPVTPTATEPPTAQVSVTSTVATKPTSQPANNP